MLARSVLQLSSSDGLCCSWMSIIPLFSQGDFGNATLNYWKHEVYVQLCTNSVKHLTCLQSVICIWRPWLGMVTLWANSKQNGIENLIIDSLVINKAHNPNGLWGGNPNGVVRQWDKLKFLEFVKFINFDKLYLKAHLGCLNDL